jgi:predicted nucleic acid-binding protein
MLYSSPELFLRTVEIFGGLTHKRFSFTDVMLLVLAKSYDVITFDLALKKAIR